MVGKSFLELFEQNINKKSKESKSSLSKLITEYEMSVLNSKQFEKLFFSDPDVYLKSYIQRSGFLSVKKGLNAYRLTINGLSFFVFCCDDEIITVYCDLFEFIESNNFKVNGFYEVYEYILFNTLIYRVFNRTTFQEINYWALLKFLYQILLVSLNEPQFIFPNQNILSQIDNHCLKCLKPITNESFFCSRAHFHDFTVDQEFDGDFKDKHVTRSYKPYQSLLQFRDAYYVPFDNAFNEIIQTKEYLREYGYEEAFHSEGKELLNYFQEEHLEQLEGFIKSLSSKSFQVKESRLSSKKSNAYLIKQATFTLKNDFNIRQEAKSSVLNAIQETILEFGSFEAFTVDLDCVSNNVKTYVINVKSLKQFIYFCSLVFKRVSEELNLRVEIFYFHKDVILSQFNHYAADIRQILVEFNE